MIKSTFSLTQIPDIQTVFEKYPNLDSEEMRFAYTNTYDKVTMDLCMEELRFSVNSHVLKRLDVWLNDLRQFSEDAIFPYDQVVLAIFQAVMNNPAFIEQNQEQCRLSRAFLEIAFKYIEGFRFDQIMYDDNYFDERDLQRSNFTDYFMNVAIFYGYYPGLAVKGLIPCFQNLKVISSAEDVYHLFNDLFVKFPVPQTLVLNFNRLGAKEIKLLANLLAGKSLRDCADKLDLPVHKKDVHHFMHTLADEKLVFENQIVLRYLIYAKLIRYSSEHELFYQMMKHNKTFSENPLKFYEDFPFWKAFLALLDANWYEITDDTRIGLPAVLDYLEYMRYQETDRTFSLAGRTLTSLIRLLDEWHEEQEFVALRKFKTAEWSLFYAEDSEIYEKNEESYQIEELNSGKLLSIEGKVLKHCVFSYVTRCMLHHTVVLGLRKKVNKAFVPWVTFETNGGEIMQAFGAMNRETTSDEQAVIKEWAKKNDVVWGY